MSDIAAEGNERKQPFELEVEDGSENFRDITLEGILNRLKPYSSDEATMLKAILSDADRLEAPAPVDIGSVLRLCFGAICKTRDAGFIESPSWRFSAGIRYWVQASKTLSRPRFLLIRAVIEHMLCCSRVFPTADWGDIAGSGLQETTVIMNLKTRSRSQDGQDDQPETPWRLTTAAPGAPL
jgi:hypothetical protein